MEACVEIEASAEAEDEVTVNMPVEALPPMRSLGLVEPLYPPHYEPPIGRALRRYFADCRRRARELRDYERIQYYNTLYQKCRRLGLRIYAHMKKNATSRPWEDYEKRIYR
ncbi:MAG TPA: hypothetical protein VJR29_06705 [bacterium]|nr:hypothetical protein [bacterium]